jgi:Family of unknown function (DUF6272)
MEVIFNFKGEINNQVLRSILKTMDEKMAEIGEDRFVRKKINSILIECLQNLIFHGEKPQIEDAEPSLTVSRGPQGQYEILTANLVQQSKVEVLGRYIDKINAMDKDQLRDYYQEVLTNGKFNPQGGAGLGIINIARKTTDQKVHQQFMPRNEQYQLFKMRMIV